MPLVWLCWVCCYKKPSHSKPPGALQSSKHFLSNNPKQSWEVKSIVKYRAGGRTRADMDGLEPHTLPLSPPPLSLDLDSPRERKLNDVPKILEQRLWPPWGISGHSPGPKVVVTLSLPSEAAAKAIGLAPESHFPQLRTPHTQRQLCSASLG